MTIRASDFTVLTVSIGYNHFLETWAKCVNKLNVKPNYVIIGVDVIDQNLKTKIDSYIPGIKWVFLEKINNKRHGHYYNQIIKLVTTTWVCKIDADDQILPSAYDELSSVSADIYAFGNVSSETGRQSIPDLDLDTEKVIFSDNNLLSSLSPFRKHVWEKNNYLDFIYDDWSFWIDAAINNFSFTSSSKPNYVYVEHASQASRKSDEKYERSVLLLYKARAKKKYLTQSFINSHKSYLIIPPDHTYPKLFSDFIEIVARLEEASTSKIYILDLSMFCSYPILNNENINSNCVQCENLILNLQNNFHFEISIIDGSFHYTSEIKIDPEIDSEFLEDIVHSNKIDCLVNARYVNEENYRSTKVFIKKFGIPIFNILSQQSPNLNNNNNKILLEFMTQFETKDLTVEKFYSINQGDFIILNNIEILTNLPVDHLIEFNRISAGFSEAISQLQKKKSLFITLMRKFLFRSL